MNQNKKYFISLLSSFLNGTAPEICAEIDWNTIYELSNQHNVTAIIANQVLALPPEHRPEKELLSNFKQQMGYTIINFDKKAKIRKELCELFNKNNIEYILVKGSVLSDYYPVKEFRTSGDIDFIIKQEDLEKINTFLPKSKCSDFVFAKRCTTFRFDNEMIEVHTNLDFDNKYFADIFSIADKNNSSYQLSDELHLLYVLTHIAKHFNCQGAGIRMFMDIDVLIRKMGESFSFDEFITLCKKANIETFSKTVLSLCNFWFNTPVEAVIDIKSDQNLLKLFEIEILDGGSFGFSERGIGEHYIKESMGQNGKKTAAVKFKAMLKMIFPDTQYLKDFYSYCENRPYLLPVAWFHRMFNAIFMRGKNSRKTVSQIFSGDTTTETQYKLLQELEI